MSVTILNVEQNEDHSLVSNIDNFYYFLYIEVVIKQNEHTKSPRNLQGDFGYIC